MVFDYFGKISITLLIFISFGETFKLSTLKNKSRVKYDVNSLVDVEFYAYNYHGNGNEIVESDSNMSWKNGDIINQEKTTRFKYLLEKILLNLIKRLPEAKLNDAPPSITHKG